MKASTLRRVINLYPPFWGAGIRVKSITPDFLGIDVELKLWFWNRNYVGTHFGGSLYALVDPFYMLMLIQNLGREYIVWDKAASIRFLKPGRGTVRAAFRLSRDQIDKIRKQADENPKVEPRLSVSIEDDEGQVVAVVEKTLYVRRKAGRTPAGPRSAT